MNLRFITINVDHYVGMGVTICVMEVWIIKKGWFQKLLGIDSALTYTVITMVSGDLKKANMKFGFDFSPYRHFENMNWNVQLKLNFKEKYLLGLTIFIVWGL